MDPAQLRAWRKSERERLVAARLSVDRERLREWCRAIDSHLEAGFPTLHRGIVGFCWPYKNEYDPRFVLRRLRERGAVTALPVVVAPRTPLLFREWHPGVRLVPGVYDIPYPADSRQIMPDKVLLPMNGFDRQGFRLGYGAGYFDRTLASLTVRPSVIGVTFELAALETIHPQPYDIPMDFIVTERGLYRRDGSTLEFLGVPQVGERPLASPVCYLGEQKL
jgi:5-formyltetrahydrofolate cyclo-ligase